MSWGLLFPTTKIQILKAIHNDGGIGFAGVGIVSDYKDTNFESNSQLLPHRCLGRSIVSDYKDTNFESNSQQVLQIITAIRHCFRLQRYKF